MSHKKFKLLVLLLDIIYFSGLMILLLYPKTSSFMTEVFERNDASYALIWGIPTMLLLVLNWQMFDEKYEKENKNGEYEKNSLKRKKQNKILFFIFNIVSIVNLFFISYFLYTLFNNTTFQIPDIIGIFSFLLFITSLSIGFSKLILKITK